MDGKQLEIQTGDPLPLNAIIYRYGPSTNNFFELEDNKSIPRKHFFDLNEADIKDGYKLSVDWKEKTTPEEGIIRIGCSHKPNSNPVIFKKYEDRVIYALEVSFVNTLKEIKDVIYEPIYHPKKVKGAVDNPAHSSIVFDEDQYKQNRPFILVELRDHAKDKKVEFDMKIVEEAVRKYRNS